MPPVLPISSPTARPGYRDNALVLDMGLNVVDTITYEAFNDLHSLHAVGDTLLIVSARSGAVLRRNLGTGETVPLARFDPRAWVCDALCVPDDVWLCCHNLSYLDAKATGGGLFSIRQSRAIVDGLSGPHSVIPYRDGYIVLDSANAQVIFFNLSGMRKTVRLEGFLRGAVVLGADTLLLAGGPDRTMSRKNPEGDGGRGLRQVLRERLRLFELKQNALARVILPEFPGFEIYDLLALPGSVGLAPNPDRIIPAEHGLFARYYYTSLITAHVRLSEAEC